MKDRIRTIAGFRGLAGQGRVGGFVSTWPQLPTVFLFDATVQGMTTQNSEGGKDHLPRLPDLCGPPERSVQ